MTRFERSLFNKRKRLIKSGRTMFIRALNEQVSQFYLIINHSNPDNLLERIAGAVTDEPMQKAFEKYYAQAATFAVDWREKLIGSQKADSPYLTIFERTMIDFVRKKGGDRIKNITETTERYLHEAVKTSLQIATEQGFGIEKTRELIKESVDAMSRSITDSRARLIAQTEMITASNTAAMEGGKSTGMKVKKFWSTSGLANVRESHIAAEQESIDKGGLDEEELFESCPGMAYPGDPAVAAEDVCNCHCSLIIDLE